MKKILPNTQFHKSFKKRTILLFKKLGAFLLTFKIHPHLYSLCWSSHSPQKTRTWAGWPLCWSLGPVCFPQFSCRCQLQMLPTRLTGAERPITANHCHSGTAWQQLFPRYPNATSRQTRSHRKYLQTDCSIHTHSLYLVVRWLIALSGGFICSS